MRSIELTGAQVRLRSPTEGDIESLVAAREAEPASFAPRGRKARERLRRQIKRNPQLREHGFLELVIERDGELVGEIQARAPKAGFPPGVCEIGLMVFSQARGQGLGAEAVELLTSHLFGEGFARVQASTEVGNTAMRRLLEHVGYAFEGVLRDFSPGEDGRRHDYAMYAITRRGVEAG